MIRTCAPASSCNHGHFAFQRHFVLLSSCEASEKRHPRQSAGSSHITWESILTFLSFSDGTLVNHEVGVKRRSAGSLGVLDDVACMYGIGPGAATLTLYLLAKRNSL